METLLASAIILIVFFVGSLTLNNVFLGAVKKDSKLLENRLKEISYGVKHNQITIPFFEETDKWDIIIEQNTNASVIYVLNKISGNEKEISIER